MWAAIISAMAFSITVLRSFIESVERLALDRETLLSGIISVDDLNAPNGWLDNAQYYEIVERAQRLHGQPALGLRIGDVSNFTAFGAAGMLFSVLPTFRDVALAMASFHGVARDRQDVFLEEDSESLSVVLDLHDAPLSVRRCIAEIVFSKLRDLLTQFAGSGGRPLRLELDYTAPEYAREYGERFAAPVLFEQRRSAMVVSQADARRVQVLHQPNLVATLRREADAQLAHAGAPMTFAARVRHRLGECWVERAPSMATVAKSLGMSERSLRRRLAAEGDDYRELLQAARRLRALCLLAERSRSIKEVANDLGFANSAAFHRAFKRWTGQTPSAYRSACAPRVAQTAVADADS